MFSFNDQRGGFATIAIVGGVAVAVVAGGVFYFLRSSPPEVDVVPKDDSATVFGEETVLSVDAEDALLRSLPRGRANDYCSLLGLEREVCADGAEGGCRDLFGSCSIDVSRDSSDTIRQFAEACLVLRTAEGRTQYFTWLDSGDPKPFPLYYAIFGLEEGAFNQKQLADAYQVLLESYFSAASCDNREALRLLTEGYLLLSDAAGRSQYDAWLNGAGGSPFSLYYSLLGLRRDTFTQQGSTDAHKALLDQYFSGYYGNNTEVLRLLTEAYMVLNDSSSQSAYNTLLDGGLASSFSDISFDSDGDKLFSALSDLNLSPPQFGAVFGSLGLSSVDLGDVAITLGLSFTDLGGFVGGLNLPPDDLSAALRDLNLSSDNLSAVLSGLNPSTDGLSAVLSDSNLSVGDLSAVLSDLDLSTDELRTVLSGLTIPSLDLQTLFTNFDIPFLGEGTPFPGVVVPPGDDTDDLLDDTDDLPAVAISSKLGQIGVENDGVQPSFLVKVTKGGSPYTPDVPITVALECEDAVRPSTQPTTRLIPGGLPESVLLSASEGTTGDLVRVPSVTGYVTCAVVADTNTDPTYRPGSPSSATVTVVSGLSGPPCDRPSCPGDPTSGPLPTVSIAAVASRVASGDDAVFRISSSSDIVGQLDVQYSCSASKVEETYLGVHEVAIQGGSGQFTATITLPTAPNTSDTVTCELLDSVKNAYRILGRSASVGVGLLGSGDIAGYDPALPTVSLIAYRTQQGNPRQFSEKVSSTVVGDTDTYIGLVIDDPESDAFGDEDPGSRKEVSDGKLYVLYVTDFGNTISVLPRGERAVTVGISKDRQVLGLDPPVPLSSAAVGDVVAEHSAYRSPPTALHHSDGGGRRWRGDFAGGDVFIEITADHRVIMRNDAAGNVIVCGYDRDALYCATYADAFTPRNIFVTAECRKEFPDRDRDREVSGLITGGLRVVNRSSEPYASPVFGYAPIRRGDPAGDLYTFIRSDGTYDVLGEDAGPNSVSSSIDIDPFLEPDATFSCELSGGGAEDGYNVGTPYAEVQVRPRATVSLGVHGAQRVADESELFGEPVAHLDRRQPEYKFSSDSGDSDFSAFHTNAEDTSEIPGVDASFGDVAASLGASLSVGFLTSFGACAGSSLLNRGISELANRIGLGGFGAVSVRDVKLELKECVLDSAVSGAVLEVLTAVARDYITWASEGFEDKPLFVKNPTTFYKNLRDDAIGRVIDRSGLGFLCDIGVPNFEAYEATLKINLQQQYLGIATDRPRCTYSDLANNLEDFYDDASDLLRDLDPDYLSSFGFTIDGTARTQGGGTFQFPPSGGFTGNQLDVLSANLDRAMKKTENSSNFLLAVSQVDSDIREARQEFDAAVKPVSQIFNPNDPTSIGAFRECDETENPEGDADCFSLNVSGSKITEMTGKGISALSDRLLHVDEFGEFGQLVGLAVNATSAGLMKKYLSKGFGHSVDRETADLLSTIEEDIAASLRPSSAREVSLSENWWSVFFERNAFYNDLLSAEMYTNDVLTLLQFIGSGLYQDPKREGDDKAYIPPIRPYTAFDTVRHAATNGSAGQFPEKSHTNLVGFSSAAFSRNFANVYSVEDVETAFEERKFTDLNGDDNWVKRRLKHIFNDWVDGESAEERGYRKMVALERFNDVYRFLSNGETRSAYNNFLGKIGSFIEEKPYKRLGRSNQWEKDLTGIPGTVKDDLKSFDSLPKRLSELRDVVTGDSFSSITYPNTYFSFSDRIFGQSEDRVCADANCRDAACVLPTQERVKGGLGSRCRLDDEDGGALHYCVAERAATQGECQIVLDPGARGGGDPVPCAVSAGCRGCVRKITKKPTFIQYAADDVEHYCPAGGTSDKLLSAHVDFVKIKQLRKIYEATLAVHIRLVGTLDEYRGAPLLSSPIHAHRREILDAYRADPDSEGLDDGGGWAVVQRETLKKFRDGTMPVYIPLNDDEFDEQEYKDLLDTIGCREADTITFQDGAFIRSYQEMKCVLGTVFQDQAYFVLRRENDDLNERRVVYLACGYDDDDPAAPGNQSNADKRFRFKDVGGNPRPLPPVTLEKGEDSVIFPVPKPIWSPFDSGNTALFNKDVFPRNYTPLAGQRIRCSIDVKRTQASADVAVDTLTQVITVSEHNDDSSTTFHSLVRNTLAGLVDPSHETRKDRVAEALFYTYVWGWYTGFIEMPYYSIQGLLSNPPVILTDSKVAVAANIQGNQEVLRRYRFLSSLFANESEPRFSSKNFGFLTPAEARAEYEHSFDDRFNGYFGRALGEFFELLPSMHQ